MPRLHKPRCASCGRTELLSRHHVSECKRPIFYSLRSRRQVNEGEIDDTDNLSGLYLRQEPWWKKPISFCNLLLTCASFILLFFHLRHYKPSGALYR